jgi:hypothetical protein
MRCLIATDAPGQNVAVRKESQTGSDIPEIHLSSSAWALQTLAESLPQFGRMCRDLCLTARVYLLSNLEYWGVVEPTGTYDPCACGSTRKTRFCSHEFGPNE